MIPSALMPQLIRNLVVSDVTWLLHVPSLGDQGLIFLKLTF